MNAFLVELFFADVRRYWSYVTCFRTLRLGMEINILQKEMTVLISFRPHSEDGGVRCDDCIVILPRALNISDGSRSKL